MKNKNKPGSADDKNRLSKYVYVANVKKVNEHYNPNNQSALLGKTDQRLYDLPDLHKGTLLNEAKKDTAGGAAVSSMTGTGGAGGAVPLGDGSSSWKYAITFKDLKMGFKEVPYGDAENARKNQVNFEGEVPEGGKPVKLSAGIQRGTGTKQFETTVSETSQLTFDWTGLDTSNNSADMELTIDGTAQQELANYTDGVLVLLSGKDASGGGLQINSMDLGTIFNTAKINAIVFDTFNTYWAGVGSEDPADLNSENVVEWKGGDNINAGGLEWQTPKTHVSGGNGYGVNSYSFSGKKLNSISMPTHSVYDCQFTSCAGQILTGEVLSNPNITIGSSKNPLYILNSFKFDGSWTNDNNATTSGSKLYLATGTKGSSVKTYDFSGVPAVRVKWLIDIHHFTGNNASLHAPRIYDFKDCQELDYTQRTNDSTSSANQKHIEFGNKTYPNITSLKINAVNEDKNSYKTFKGWTGSKFPNLTTIQFGFLGSTVTFELWTPAEIAAVMNDIASKITAGDLKKDGTLVWYMGEEKAEDSSVGSAKSAIEAAAEGVGGVWTVTLG